MPYVLVIGTWNQGNTEMSEYQKLKEEYKKACKALSMITNDNAAMEAEKIKAWNARRDAKDALDNAEWYERMGK
jgi:hypothetical protein